VAGSREPWLGRTLRVVTRQSRLAMSQTQQVVDRIRQQYPEITIEIIPVQSEGDVVLDQPLAKIGGKGLFTKALEERLLADEADLAIHSLKDMPAGLPEGLTLCAVLERADPRDAFISLKFPDVARLPSGAVVGTSSLRRQAQLLHWRPDIKTLFLRGNVETRLAKLERGEYDAIILAVAGLMRLGMGARVTESLSIDRLLPAVGQGALGLECRAADTALQQLVMPLVDKKTTAEVLAERAMNARLGGSCQTPIAGYATWDGQGVGSSGGLLTLRGLVASPDGKTVLRAEAKGASAMPEALGVAVAEALLAQGAARWIGEGV